MDIVYPPPPPPPSGEDAMDRRCILQSSLGKGDAHGSADACVSWQKVQGREANRRCHRPTEPTPKALCQTPRPPSPPPPPPRRMTK